METVGLIIAIFGGVFTLAFALALSVSKNPENEASTFLMIDTFLIGGIISFFLGLARGISDTFHNRSSSAFAMTVLFTISVSILSLGLWMLS